MSTRVRRAPVQAVSVRSSPQRAKSTPSTLTCSRVRVLAQRASLSRGPCPWRRGGCGRWRRSGSERGAGRSWRSLGRVLFHEHRHQQLEQRRASTRARLSGDILPSATTRSAPSASNSVAAITVAMGRHHRAEHREALSQRQAPAPALGLALDALAVNPAFKSLEVQLLGAITCHSAAPTPKWNVEGYPETIT